MEPELKSLVIWYVLFAGVLLPVNGYIFMRGWQTLPEKRVFRWPYAGLYLFLSLSYFVGRAIEKVSICAASDALFWTGSFWFGIMLYLFIAALLVDAVRLLNRFLPFLPEKGTAGYARVKRAAAAGAVVITLAVQSAGFFHARETRVTGLELDIPKWAGGMEALTIALVTDIHLGTIISNGRLAVMVEKVNRLEPDIVLLAGDMVDEDVAPVLEKNMGELLKNLRSRFGTYAVTGNHEYYGDVEETCRYLERSGVTMLRDRAVRIGDFFYLAGRDEATKETQTGGRCLPLPDILRGVDTRLPVILMDHNPARIRETRGSPVDLSLSGHTHDGQLWPIGLITRRVYEISRGHRMIGATHFFVSQGFGTWGPPVRVGTDSEIVRIVVRFRKTPGSK
ncbi:MAG TPA: metallophosphoesterase [Spirochaetota bacterium]|nr:metallophosphoesterase [Spirochaetota bacterium]HOD14877.1 metallophosphoesterase [Spirochaetota bacterium]HPG49301.1 metallophosphoesterase [Spirochaetota bacterium]HPN10723.1 metallophosphoesterase [Spirochaetota bacterium]